jgi:predicted acyl esterase
MQKDQVYKVTFQPMQTSFYFAAGDQLRVEISSSNFPLSDRNLNTGGENYNEWKGEHKSAQCASLPTVTALMLCSVIGHVGNRRYRSCR